MADSKLWELGSKLWEFDSKLWEFEHESTPTNTIAASLLVPYVAPPRSATVERTSGDVVRPKSRTAPSAVESTTAACPGRSSSSGLEASRHPYARIAPVRRFKGCGHRLHVGAERLARRNGSAWWRSRRSSTRVDRDSLRGGPSCPGARAATMPTLKATGTVVDVLSTFRARVRVGVGGAFMLPPLHSDSRDRT